MDPTPAPPPPRSNRTAWILATLGILLGTVAGVVAWRVLQAPRVPPETPLPVVDAGAPTPPDAGPTVSIEDGDALLKKLAAGWTTDALFAKWLELASLRHLVAAVQAVADGHSPRASLPFVSITGGFAVREEDAPRKKGKKAKPSAAPERLFIAKETYARFDAPTKALTSVPAASAGAAYAHLRPYLDAVFSEVGRPGQRFDDVFRAALQRLVSVKVPDGEVEVVGKGAVYAFKDEAFEALSPAEKHVLRLGPDNARAVQAWLRAFGAAAGLQ